jgi:hypothetical protein
VYEIDKIFTKRKKKVWILLFGVMPVVFSLNKYRKAIWDVARYIREAIHFAWNEKREREDLSFFYNLGPPIFNIFIVVIKRERRVFPFAKTNHKIHSNP